MSKKADEDFEAECRRKFAMYCALYKAQAFHVDKRRYIDKAYEVIDAFLDFGEIDSL